MKNDKNNWLTIDREGFAQLIEHRGKGWILCELLQNAWDQNVSEVSVAITEVGDRDQRLPRDAMGTFIVSVIDDDPAGWVDITHAYTMFAPSAKKSDPTKRGRFNLGEKMVLSLAEWAEIRTVNHAIRFDENGRTEIPDCRRESGSQFLAAFRFTSGDIREIAQTLSSLIPPEGIKTSWKITSSDPRNLSHSSTLEHRTPAKSFAASLPTLIEGEGGKMKPTTRKASVTLHEPTEGEVPTIYEMGIPVVEVGEDDRWHIDVGQKVPLNMDRDNVTPAYLRTLRVAVLNEAHTMLSEDEARTTWVTAASEDKRCTEDATEKVMDSRFGEKRVAYDPSDKEANRIAAAEGYTVVHGGALTKGQWENVKSSESLPPAGQVTPSNSVLQGNPNGKDPAIPEKKWTEDMRRTVTLARLMAEDLMGVEVAVRIVLDKKNRGTSAWYGGRSLTFNLQSLGHKFFKPSNLEGQVDLILHEFGHEYESNHLSANYYHALTRLGAKLAVDLSREGSSLRRMMRKIDKAATLEAVTA